MQTHTGAASFCVHGHLRPCCAWLTDWVCVWVGGGGRGHGGGGEAAEFVSLGASATPGGRAGCAHGCEAQVGTYLPMHLHGCLF